MNISSLIRGLLGDAKPGDVKQLDMKTGQVVRGVVLSVSEDGQEAVVQIQGVKVRAALETPLEAGQATLLQVQPPGENGMMVLKPLTDSPNAALPIKSMADVLQGLGLADTDDNRALVEAMRASGIPLTKENAELLGRIMQQKPAGVPLPEWVQSAAIALQRGLPVTGESVRGLQQAVFGPPVHELLAQLEAELDAAQVPGGKGMPAPGDAATANRPAQGAPVSSGALIQAGEDQAQPQGSAMKEAAVQGGGGGAQAPAAGASAGAGGLAPLLAKLQQVLGQLRTAPLTALAVQQGGAAAGANGLPAAETAPPQAQAAQAGSGSAAAPEGPTPGAEPWVGRLLKLLGAEHEQQGVRGAMQPAQDPAARGARPQAAAPAVGRGAAPEAGQAEPGPASGGARAAGAAAAARPPAPAPAGAGVRQAANLFPAADSAGMRAEHALQSAGTPQDTLKGVLLQLMNHDEAPPALKEAAQQLVSHLTGQQLLLNTDRTAPFAQVTLFLPLNGPDGQETASVQIQSRRGPKGELDAANCRLWFDLQMKHLGQTLVDVQVVNRIVSLKVHNPYEWAGALLENNREEISGAMEAIGYQLLTLKAEPMPEKPAETAAAVKEYVPQSYKGVDFRV
ncbi:hypothetical protein ACM1RC_00640 [Paenibacillus azoreducens]|uniref:hypothetical protein n=1 Tax=Paenibacillus azoreducens TaxID=116718 RepID=UPI0039F49866